MRFAYNKLRCICTLAILNILCLQVTVQADEAIRWAPDLKSAQQASAQFGVPVLVHFYGDDCLPCKTLETRVFSRVELVDTLNKYFICVRVNASHNKQLAADYGVHSWPTDVFLSPQGQVLYQGVCPQNAETYKGVVQNVAIMNRDNNALLASQQAAQQASPKTTMQQNYASQPMQQAGLAAQQISNPAQQISPPRSYAAQTENGELPPRNNANFTQTADGSTKLLPPPEAMGKYAQHASEPVPYSKPPADSVISGPIDMQSQPQSIQTAMQPAVNRPMSNSPNRASGTGSLASNQVQLPPRSTAGMVPPANPMSAGTQAELSQISSMPVMTTQQMPQPNSSPVFQPASNVVSKPSRTMTNPYFQDTHSYSAPKQPTATQTQMVAQPQNVGQQANLRETHTPTADYVVGNAPNAEDANASQAAMVPAGEAVVSSSVLTSPAAASTQVFAQQAMSSLPPSTEPVQSTSESTSESAQIDSALAMQAGTDQTLTTPATQSSVSTSQPSGAFQPRPGGANEGLSGEGVAFAQASNNVVEGEVGLVEESPALEGYCPIALVTKADWVEGSKERSVRHRGKVYWLSSEEAKLQFLKAPDQSSPLASGYDPYILLEEGRLVEGSIQFGLHEEISGVFMLFSSPENKQKYWDDYDRYSRALEALLSRARQQ
ncbi:MAG: thioredoxin family protein [Pirellulaceae bacterium]